MKKNTLYYLSIFISINLSAQVAATKLVNKNNRNNGIGYGFFIKGSYPISENSDLTFELGFNQFSKKTDSTFNYSNVPIKLGYRFIFNKKRYGFHLGPAIGLNISGLISNTPKASRFIPNPDTEFGGVIVSSAFGYSFNPRKLNLNIELIYERNIIKKNEDLGYVGIRIYHNFYLKKRRV